MRRFVLGVLVLLIVAALGAFAFLRLGFMPTNADATPTGLEEWVANPALDASVDRRAPHTANPVPITDGTLIDGLKVYAMNCAVCHGGFNGRPSALAHAFYPPPPQLILDPLDDPEWHISYVIGTGVRYTGMPAWRQTLSPEDIWKVTAFLARVENLPPAVQAYWRTTFGTTPPAATAPHGG